MALSQDSCPDLAEVHFNGRFLGSPRTGVQRVAHELITSLDARLAAAGNQRAGSHGAAWTLIHPEGVPLPDLKVIRPEPLPGLPGPLWEQVSLARRSRGACLVNLANTAPLVHSGSILMIHDAQVHASPASYSAAFRTWYRFLQPRIATNARRLLTVSQFSAAELASYGIVPREPVAVVPNGLDHILRIPEEPGVPEALGLIPGGFLLGFASTQAHKNTELLFRVMRDPRLAGQDLVLVGKSIPHSLTPPPGVRLLGRIDDSRLRALYASCLGLLFPSRTEGFGLPPGEAMLCGAPVIAARSGALPEFYDGAAELLPADSDEDWIVAAARLRTDPAWRAGLIDRGRARAESMGWLAAAERLRDVINGTLKEMSAHASSRVPQP